MNAAGSIGITRSTIGIHLIKGALLVTVQRLYVDSGRQGESESAREASYPSPVTLRLMKAPERDTLSPRERAVDSVVTPSPQGRGLLIQS
jgi:hypothetical protein